MTDQYGQPIVDDPPQGGTGATWAAAPPAPPAPPVPPAATNGARRGGIAAGLILIAIGFMFLAGQVIPGLMWWNLWPLIIVLVGVIQMFTPSRGDEWTPERLLDGLGTVFLGAVLLGNTLGIVSWGVWWTFITLWPVLLIALGVSILGKGLHIGALRALAPVIVWAALAYSVATSLTGVAGFQPMPQLIRPTVAGQAFAFDEPMSGDSTGTFLFKGGAGDFTIGSGSSLVSASGNSPYGRPTLAVSHSADGATAAFSMGNAEHMVIVPGVSTSKADVKLSNTVLWDAEFETGACNMNADFSAVLLRKLTFKTGASSATVKLGEVPFGTSNTDVSIKAGVSNIEILVPRDAAVRLDTHNGLSGTEVVGTLRSTGSGVWETEGFAAATKTITISVESGVSSISLRTY